MSLSDISLSPKQEKADRLALKHLLFRAEWWLVGLVAALCVGCVVNATLRHQAVAWVEFFPAFGASAMLVALGMYIRATRPMPQMALGAIGFGIFMAFSGSVAIFIFTLFPFASPLIDPSLMTVDAALGYRWIGFVEYIAQYPAIGVALHYVYLSILPQMVGVIILLAFLHRPVDLHRFLTVGILCMIITVAFWWAFPSVGPSAFGMVSEDIQEKIKLIANAAYGEDMRRLSYDGISLISPSQITGVIALPSFHMIMACMVVWFTRGTLAFFPVVLVNIAMVPATLIHGGHHLVDLFGGVFTFTVCLWAASRLIPKPLRD